MRFRALVASILVAAGAVGCASADKSDDATTSPPSSASAPISAPSSAPIKPAGLVVDISIKGGAVTPTNAVLQAKVGEPIEFRVTSDAIDELHVHSNPEHTFEVAAKPDQTFSFTVDVPGSVAVELHDLGRTVATIQVRP